MCMAYINNVQYVLHYFFMKIIISIFYAHFNSIPIKVYMHSGTDIEPVDNSFETLFS